MPLTSLVHWDRYIAAGSDAQTCQPQHYMTIGLYDVAQGWSIRLPIMGSVLRQGTEP